MSLSPDANNPSGRARRRAAVWGGSEEDPDGLKRWLCAKIFQDPACVVDALTHPVRGRFEVAPHRHSDLLQLDVIEGCRGEAVIGERRHVISETTVMAVPPGLLHGYELALETERAAVWVVKIRLRGLESNSNFPLPDLLTGLGSMTSLRQDIAGFIGDWTPQGVGMVAIAKLAMAICSWPSSMQEVDSMVDHAMTPQVEGAFDGPSARVRQAIQTLGQRMDNPPSMEELASAAHMSERHFARRFRQDFGCTPHAYLSARRLDAARGMLREAERPVADVAEVLGFSSPAAFSRWFTRLAGQSPRKFRSDPHNH